MKRLRMLLFILIFLMMPKRVIASELPPAPATAWTVPVPAAYFGEAGKKGRVERITYPSKDYAGDGESVEKVACVYLPYGYDENPSEKYDVFYVMHGWSGTADEFFGYGGGMAKNMLDNMIEKGNIDPLIVVSPTFDAENKPQGFERAEKETKAFYRDFSENLLPAVEGKYRTYAENVSSEAFADSREHRAFGGFSMGSVTTWEQFIMNSDYIYYYLPMSSSCWHFGGYGSARPKENCDLFQQTILEKDLNERGYFIYACTGTNDTLRGELEAQINEMFSRKDVFTPDRLVYHMKNGGLHDYNAGMEYIYNALPLFFEDLSEPVFYDIYSNFEKIRDKSKKKTGMYLFAANGKESQGKNLPKAAVIIVKTAADSDSAAVKNSFSKARELAKQGYNVFVPVLRSGSKADTDLNRAYAYIKDNSEYLNTDASDILKVPLSSP